MLRALRVGHCSSSSGNCRPMAPSVNKAKDSSEDMEAYPAWSGFVTAPPPPQPSAAGCLGIQLLFRFESRQFTPLSIRGLVYEKTHCSLFTYFLWVQDKCCGLNEVCAESNVGNPSPPSLTEVSCQLRTKNYSTVDRIYYAGCLPKTQSSFSIMLRGLGPAQWVKAAV